VTLFEGNAHIVNIGTFNLCSRTYNGYQPVRYNLDEDNSLPLLIESIQPKKEGLSIYHTFLLCERPSRLIDCANPSVNN